MMLLRLLWAELKQRLESLGDVLAPLAQRSREPRFAVSAAVAGVGFLIVMAIYVSLPQRVRPSERLAYYYDLRTQELFVDSAVQTPPILSPTDGEQDQAPSGVRAHVFGCGDSSDPSNRYIGFLETSGDQGVLVRRVTDEDWVKMKSEAGFAIIHEAGGRCGEGEDAVRCEP